MCDRYFVLRALVFNCNQFISMSREEELLMLYIDDLKLSGYSIDIPDYSVMFISKANGKKDSYIVLESSVSRGSVSCRNLLICSLIFPRIFPIFCLPCFSVINFNPEEYLQIENTQPVLNLLWNFSNAETRFLRKGSQFSLFILHKYLLYLLHTYYFDDTH